MLEIQRFCEERQPRDPIGEATLPPFSVFSDCCFRMGRRNLQRKMKKDESPPRHVPKPEPRGTFLHIFTWRGGAAAAVVPILTGTFLCPSGMPTPISPAVREGGDCQVDGYPFPGLPIRRHNRGLPQSLKEMDRPQAESACVRQRIIEHIHWIAHGVFLADLIVRTGLTLRVIRRRLPRRSGPWEKSTRKRGASSSDLVVSTRRLVCPRRDSQEMRERKFLTSPPWMASKGETP